MDRTLIRDKPEGKVADNILVIRDSQRVDLSRLTVTGNVHKTPNISYHQPDVLDQAQTNFFNE